MREWSRALRERALQALAGAGLMLALAVLAFVLMATAFQGDRNLRSDDSLGLSSGAGFRDGASNTMTEGQGAELRRGTNDPTSVGVVLGVLLFAGGLTVLGWGARRPRLARVDLEELLADRGART